MHPTLAKHLAAINAGQVERTNIIGIRKAINNMERGRYARGFVHDTDEVFALEEALREREPRVGTDVAMAGMKVMDNPRNAKRLTPAEREIYDNLDVFKLVAFQRIGRAGGWQTTPVFRAVSQNGDSFLFRNIPWQTAQALGMGGGLEIVNEGEF